MRPFYEQYHHRNNPYSRVGPDGIRGFVSDFSNWHQDAVQETDRVCDKNVYMTAASMLDHKAMRQTVRRGVSGYSKSMKEWSDFLAPKTFAAMNVMHALVMPMPKVQPADKLHVGKYIPKRLANRVRTARIVKIWARDEKVSFAGVPPGSYYLKATRGSAYNLRIQIPCSNKELFEARKLSASWMAETYGLNSCQWWYQFIMPHVFLEEDLAADREGASIEDFRFHVINGKAAVLQLDVGLHTDERHNPIYDSDLNYMPHNFLRQNLREEPLPPQTQSAQEIAIELGKQFQYCRVDLYVKGDDIYLGELTFLPNAGRRRVGSRELDEYLCSHWVDKLPVPARLQ